MPQPGPQDNGCTDPIHSADAGMHARPFRTSSKISGDATKTASPASPGGIDPVMSRPIPMNVLRHLLPTLTLCLHCLLMARTLAEAESVPPVIVALFPEAGPVFSLAQLEVHFSEPVQGVDASDLRANGLAATSVRRVSADVYVFTLPELPVGPNVLTWAADADIRDLADTPNRFAGDATLEYRLLPPPRPGGVILSEVMPDNQKTLRDEEGDYEDWIELQNITDQDISLAGWHLTDDPTDATPWTFPDITLPARGFLVVFASGKDRASVTNRLHTDFKLKNEGEYLALSAPDGVVVDAFAPRYPATPVNVAYGRANGDASQGGFLATPTPGAANSVSGIGFAPAVVFSRNGGLVLDPRLNLEIRLSLSEPAADAIIRYSLDGRIPTLTNGFTYAAPLVLNTNNAVMLRARAFRTNHLPGPVRSEYYTPMFVSSAGPVLGTNAWGEPIQTVSNPNIQQFRSDLPLLVITTFGKSPSESTNAVVALSLFEPRNGVARVTGPPDFTARGGIKIRGSSSAGLAKKQYAIQWTDEYNQDLEKPVLGMPSESEWVLYAPNDFEPVCIHNPFMHQLARDIGEYSPRTRFVEVFMNRLGPLATNQYEGLYVLTEKIGVGGKRIPGPKLQPEDNTLPDITGPYVMKIDRLDPGDSGLSMGGQTVAMITPKEKELKQVQRAAQRKYLTDYLNGMSRGFLAANRRNPTNSYENFIEMGRAIDYHILEMLSGNVDTMVLSAYLHKPRNQKLIFGPHWDFDRALGSTDGRDSNPRSWTSGPVFAGWFGQILQDTEAWQRWVDRFQQLRTNQLSLRYTGMLMDRLANQVRQAERRDYQRWKIPRRGGGYQAELDSMKRWVSNRLDFVDRQLAQPPVASLDSGIVVPGTTLTLSLGPNASANAAIWYTLDGTDPRAIGSSNRSAAARLYSGPIPITGPVRLVARTLDPLKRQTSGPPISTPWSGPLARTLLTSAPPLALSEIHFHPSDRQGDRSFDPDDSEFLELKNTSGGPLDLAGFRLEGDVAFTFNTTNGTRILAPNARVVLASDNSTFRSRYGAMAEHLGKYAGRLSDGGGRLRLVDPRGDLVFDFTFSDQWIPPADGDGYSMVLRSEALQAFEIDTPAAWVASAQADGSPGRPDLASDVGPGTDSDGDGLADVWELAFFGTLQTRADGDPDGDGATNREEFRAGTLPGDPRDRPMLETVPAPFEGNPVLRFPRRGARAYRLQFRDSLTTDATPPWRDLLDFPAQAGEGFGEFRDLTTTNATRFYRIVTP